MNIASYTQEDEFAGLADPERMAAEIPDLDLFHPWSVDADQARDLAIACEAAGLEHDKRIVNSDGAAVSSGQMLRIEISATAAGNGLAAALQLERIAKVSRSETPEIVIPLGTDPRR